MSELNLPASLERLEINPESFKIDQNRNIMSAVSEDPECTLQSLSLKAECPKGNCNCNRKRDKESTVKRVPFKRPIVRRSKLNPLVLRSPVLRLRDNQCSSLSIANSPHCSKTKEKTSITTEEQPRNNTRLSEEIQLNTEDEDRICNPASNSTPLASSSCAIQARSSPDDTTIDELASYFDLFVHIPKKMSFMAEMMYT